MPVPKTPISAMASRIAGKAIRTSSGRMMSWSSTPSAYPARRPSGSPTTRAKSTDETATSRETR